MVDIALDASSHDIIFRDGDIIFIDNAERVAQQIKVQLLTFYGEWFLDKYHGVPYLEYILVKNPDTSLIRELLREQILEVTDVKNVESIEVEYDVSARTLLCEYEASTEYGLVERKEVLGYGYR